MKGLPVSSQEPTTSYLTSSKVTSDVINMSGTTGAFSVSFSYMTVTLHTATPACATTVRLDLRLQEALHTRTGQGLTHEEETREQSLEDGEIGPHRGLIVLQPCTFH